MLPFLHGITIMTMDVESNQKERGLQAISALVAMRLS
jgi:hypothetical protein